MVIERLGIEEVMIGGVVIEEVVSWKNGSICQIEPFFQN